MLQAIRKLLRVIDNNQGKIMSAFVILLSSPILAILYVIAICALNWFPSRTILLLSWALTFCCIWLPVIALTRMSGKAKRGMAFVVLLCSLAPPAALWGPPLARVAIARGLVTVLTPRVRAYSLSHNRFPSAIKDVMPTGLGWLNKYSAPIRVGNDGHYIAYLNTFANDSWIIYNFDSKSWSKIHEGVGDW